MPKRGDLVSVEGEENFRLLTTALFSHQVQHNLIFKNVDYYALKLRSTEIKPAINFYSVKSR